MATTRPYACCAATLLITTLPLLCSCRPGGDRVRQYREVNVHAEPAPAETQAVPTARPETVRPAQGALHWDTPEGWAEERGSGMRLASFTIVTPQGAGQCTMIILVGAAGGLDANIQRWLGQVELSISQEDDFRSFVDAQERFTTRGGFPVVRVDLTGLTEVQSDQTDSMVVGVITLGEQTMFVKLTGPVALLNAEKDRLSSLCRSIRFE